MGTAAMSDLEVSPTELAFKVQPEAYSTRQLRLQNRGQKAMAFKIKTTNPKQYFVRPNQGIVPPLGRKVIHVMMGKVPELPKEKCKDRFLVQSAPYDGEEPDDKFEWKTHFSTDNPLFAGNATAIPKPVEVKLKCSYILPNEEDPTDKLPTTAGGGGGGGGGGGSTDENAGPVRRPSKEASSKAPAVTPGASPSVTQAKAATKTSNSAPINQAANPAATKAAAAAGPAYTVWILIAVLFFLLGRYTTQIAIPGTDL